MSDKIKAAVSLEGATVLETAMALTEGERAERYGNVLEAAKTFAALASAMTGLKVKPEHFPLMMEALKFSRLAQAPAHWDRDSWTDVAGWARVAEMLSEQAQGDDGTVEVADGLELTLSQIEALHFHYTKHGVADTQTAAKALEAKLTGWIKSKKERGKDGDEHSST